MRAVPAFAVACLAASGAEAGPLFASYEAHCVEARAEPAAVLSSADASGWMPLPKAMLDQISTSAMFKDVRGRLRSSERSLEILIVGRMEQKVGRRQLQMQFCGVGSMPPDADLKNDLVAWANVAPVSSGQSGRVLYAFVEEGGRRRPVELETANGLKLIRDGRVVVAAVEENRQSTMALFAVPTTSENP